MTVMNGRNINTNDEVVTTTVTINSVTATTLAADNPNRLWIRISLDSGTTDIEAFIREYPATDDNIKHGEILVRSTSGNNSLFKPLYETDPDNVYTGEISALAVLGSFDLHIMEG